MTNWQYFPMCDTTPKHLQEIVNVFKSYESQIHTDGSNPQKRKSNEVLGLISSSLVKLGYEVEGKQKSSIGIPVLFGKNDKIDKSFNADAYNQDLRTVIEVEAGTATANNGFLKDLIQACLMHNTDYLVIAVCNEYKHKVAINKDFDKVTTMLNTIYISQKLKLPLKGVLIIGY
ncbi:MULTISPECIES: hypothetical protein [Bacteroides]|uniref:hypothetical protein n=1 Tax=Bacteroides TaxID=816 RepID=UPI0005A72A4C|nr:hypothetical protein [Bacteroides neonati]